VCGEVPNITPIGLERLKLGFDILKLSLPQTFQQPYDQFYQIYTGRKFAVYDRAKDSLMVSPVDRNDARVSAFVKNEKVAVSKVNPDPRMIQFRRPKFCVDLASYLKPIEEHLYALRIDHKALGPYRLIGKGLNNAERASLYIKKLARFSDPVTLSLDASRFDQHVSRELLQLEHSVYLSCCNDPHLAYLLNMQLSNKVTTKGGYAYTTNGRRMSGDMNTALGNCVIMLGMVLSYLVPKDIKFDLFDDGDDILVITESSNLDLIRNTCVQEFLEFGHEMKIEGISFKPWTTTWCQSNPIKTTYGWKFVRDPFKVLLNTLISTKWQNVPRRVKLEHLAAIAQCEMVLNSGVPVLHEYAIALLRVAGDSKPRFEQGTGDFIKYSREMRLYKFRDAHTQPISDESRFQFAEAFGISVSRQLDMEEHLRSWTFDFGVPYMECGIRDPRTWEVIRTHRSEVS
jgi:hypothetical protein